MAFFKGLNGLKWSDFRLALTVTLTALLLFASAASARPVSAAKLRVVATFSILGDLVKNVAGDAADIAVLVGPDGDTHTYQPKPTDSRALAQADVIVEIGSNFEEWLDELAKASGTKAKRVVVTQAEGVKLLEGGHYDDDDHDKAKQQATPAATSPANDHDEDAAKDPHVWHDVSNTIAIVKYIRDALSAADAANAAAYKTNADKYILELQALDKALRDEAAKLPQESRKLVTSHDAFGYFAAAYDFKIVGYVLPVSTEAADPSAAQIRELVQLIKESAVKAIFEENVSASRLVERVAREAGVKVAPPLLSDALGTTPQTDTYIKLMRYNISTIVTALQ
jgi:zinc/manganese transport system substrate-binding protein